MRKVQVLSGTKGFRLLALVIAALVVSAACKQPTDTDPVVPPVPVISITSQPKADTVVTKGSTGSLTVSATVTEGAALSFQWYKNSGASNEGGNLIDGATAKNFPIPTLTTGTYYYYCVVSATGEAVPVSSNTAKVTVVSVGTPIITITTQPKANTEVTEGRISRSLTVAASVTEGAAPFYQWYRNTSDSNSGGTAVTGAASAIFVIPPALTTGTYYYYCVVSATGKAVPVSSNAATVKVNPPGTPLVPEITINTHPTGFTVTEGSITGSLTVSASVTEGAALSYQWYRNTSDSYYGSTPVTGATGTSYTIPPDTTRGTYYYYCVVSVTGEAVSFFSKTAKVTVSAPLVPKITINTHPADITVTEDSITGSLTVSASVTEGAALSYQWYRNTSDSYYGSTPVTGATGTSYTIPPDTTRGTYYYYCVVSATGGAEPVRSEAAKVTINAPPPSSPVELTFNTWKYGNIPSSGVREEWFTFRAVGTTQYIHAYFDTLTDLYVQLYDSVMNTVGDRTNLWGRTKYISRSLTPNQTYYIKITPYSGSGNYSILVNNASTPPVFPVPVITIDTQPQDRTVTEGEISGSLSVAASVTEGAALSYQWYRNTSDSNSGGTAVTGATEMSFTIPTTLARGTYYYYCEVGAAYGAKSVKSEAAAVTVNHTDGDFVIQLSYMDDPNLIEQTAYTTAGTDKTFTITGMEFTEYQWYLNGEKDENESTATYTFNKGTGTYELAVVVSNAAGEKYSGRCLVTVR